MNKQRDGARVKIARAMDLPAADFEKSAHIEFLGNREVVVEGCRGIIEYDQRIIRLNIGKHSVKFCGTDMYMRNMTDEYAVIVGNIFSMEFCS